MNVRCPACQTVFRVDPAKVPVGGVRARCSVCAGVFPVERPATPVPPQPAPSPPVAVAPPPPPTAPPPPPPPSVTPAPGVAAPVAAPAPMVVHPMITPAPVVAPPVPAPVTPAPVFPPVVEPVPVPPRPARRVVNPFLAQDPQTRARRLARALISDLVVYHPAKRAEGIRDGTLKVLFDEDIRRCWEEYTEQVGMELATTTRYFTEALNEILADGQPVFT